MKQAAGSVTVVGAGPGDADLLTLRGQSALGTADVVVPALAAADVAGVVAQAQAGAAVAVVVPDVVLRGDTVAALVDACAKARVPAAVVPGVPALAGVRVLVPRAAEQAGGLLAELRALGAAPVEVPAIAIAPPVRQAALRAAVGRLAAGGYAWVAFTSTNAVRAVRTQVESAGLDARALAGCSLAAVGPATADALREWGLRPDLVPSGGSTSEQLGAEWPVRDPAGSRQDRVLLPRADIATDTLVTAVAAKGWVVDDVVAYRTVRAPRPPAGVRALVRDGGLDAVVFTSSSTVRNLLDLCGPPHERTVVAVIGPRTAATAAEVGLRVDVVARESTAAGLVRALAEHLAGRFDLTSAVTREKVR